MGAFSSFLDLLLRLRFDGVDIVAHEKELAGTAIIERFINAKDAIEKRGKKKEESNKRRD